MVNVFHHKEPFGDSGSAYGTSTKRALGRPNLRRWEMFTREALQNSWDARDTRSHTDGVTFAIDYRTLNENAVGQLREFFGEDLTGVEDTIGTYLEQSDPAILVVSDRGTSGLQGPTSAATHVESKDDFVSFVRNIGRDSTKTIGGGTYGFGKGVFFDASQINAILVYTRTHDEEGEPANRFIAMAITEAFHIDDVRFTGRHWWGIQADGLTSPDFAEPVTGEDADKLAEAFGMDLYFTEAQPTGTSVAVLDPTFETTTKSENSGEELVADCMDEIAHSLTKWAWPHMIVEHEGMDPIRFVVTNQGENVEIPDPMEDPGLRHILKAYQELISHPEPAYHEVNDEWMGSTRYRLHDIASKQPAEYLGRLCMYQLSRAPQASTTTGHTYDHHIALLRKPRMVVEYWPGPTGATGSGYGGVFLASSHLDALFAASEPPAHDEWTPKTVDLTDPRYFQPGKDTPRKLNPVEVTFEKLEGHLKEILPDDIELQESESSSAIVNLSNMLGKILTDGPTTRSPQVKIPDAKDEALGKAPAAGVSTSTTLELLETTTRGTVAVFKVNAVLSNQISDGVALRIKPTTVAAGKRYAKPSGGIPIAIPLGWVDPYDPTLDWESLATRAQNPQPTDVEIRENQWEHHIAVLQPRNTATMITVVTEPLSPTGTDMNAKED